MAALAEFERDLLRSGVVAAQARGVKFGRQAGVRVKAEKYTGRVLHLRTQGRSYREIGRALKLSKNTVMDIVRHH